MLMEQITAETMSSYYLDVFPVRPAPQHLESLSSYIT